MVGPELAATLPGLKAAVAPAGSPVTESVTAEAVLSPLGGVTDSLYLAVPPGCTVADVDPPLGGAKVKSSTVWLTVVLVTALKLLSPE